MCGASGGGGASERASEQWRTRRVERVARARSCRQHTAELHAPPTAGPDRAHVQHGHADPACYGVRHTPWSVCLPSAQPPLRCTQHPPCQRLDLPPSGVPTVPVAHAQGCAQRALVMTPTLPPPLRAVAHTHRAGCAAHLPRRMDDLTSSIMLDARGPLHAVHHPHRHTHRASDLNPAIITPTLPPLGWAGTTWSRSLFPAWHRKGAAWHGGQQRCQLHNYCTPAGRGRMMGWPHGVGWATNPSIVQ